MLIFVRNRFLKASKIWSKVIYINHWAFLIFITKLFKCCFCAFDIFCLLILFVYDILNDYESDIAEGDLKSFNCFKLGKSGPT